MPRQPRLDAPGVLHHVMARGIERRAIFIDDKDRKSFLDRLAEVLEKTQTQCYAWSLIPNHFHLLLRTGPTPLSTIMRRLMTGHAVVFNKRHHRTGHLFQNRYKSVICEEDRYLLELVRYIHLNPIRAGLVQGLEELDIYPFTGHSVLLGKHANPLIPDMPPIGQDKRYLADKTIEDVLRHFGKTIESARIGYREFVENGIEQGRRPELQGGGLARSAGGDKAALKRKGKDARELSDQRILGSGDFVAEVLKGANEWAERRVGRDLSLNDLIEMVCKRFGIDPKDLVRGNRRGRFSRMRAIISYLAVCEFGYKGTEVAMLLSVSAKAVSRGVEKGRSDGYLEEFLKE